MQPLHKAWVKYFVFVQHVPFKECKVLCKHHLVEAYYSHMLQVSCILILPIDRLRNRVTSTLEEESGICELHWIKRLLYPTDVLYEFLSVTSTTQCPYCASDTSCLGMWLRLSQSLPKVNMNKCKPSEEQAAIPQEDLLETQVYTGSPCTYHLQAVMLALAMEHSLKYEWDLKLQLKPCLSRNLYVKALMFTHNVLTQWCSGQRIFLILGVSLDTGFHFCNTLSLTAFMTQWTTIWYDQNQRSVTVFTCYISITRVLTPWRAIMLYEQDYAMISCAPVSLEQKPCRCHFLGRVRQCKSSLLLTLPRPRLCRPLFGESVPSITFHLPLSWTPWISTFLVDSIVFENHKKPHLWTSSVSEQSQSASQWQKMC